MNVSEIHTALFLPLLLALQWIHVIGNQKEFHIRITPDTVPSPNGPRPVVWDISVECPDCHRDHRHKSGSTRNEPGEYGKAVFQIVPKRNAEIRKLVVKIESMSLLSGKQRSYKWTLERPNFEHIHHFQFGHFARSPTADNKGLYLRMKFKAPGLAEPIRSLDNSVHFTKYVARLELDKIMFNNKISEKLELTQAQWNGGEEFEMKLKDGITNVLRENKQPSMWFIVKRIALCGVCGKADERRLKQMRECPDYVHAECFYQNYVSNDPKCPVCKRRIHSPFFASNHNLKPKEEFFRAYLKMPILQNGDEPQFVYEFDRARPHAELNRITETPLNPPPAPADPAAAPENAAATNPAAAAQPEAASSAGAQPADAPAAEAAKEAKPEEAKKDAAGPSGSAGHAETGATSHGHIGSSTENYIAYQIQSRLDEYSGLREFNDSLRQLHEDWGKR